MVAADCWVWCHTHNDDCAPALTVNNVTKINGLTVFCSALYLQKSKKNEKKNFASFWYLNTPNAKHSDRIAHTKKKTNSNNHISKASLWN